MAKNRQLEILRRFGGRSRNAQLRGFEFKKFCGCFGFPYSNFEFVLTDLLHIGPKSNIQSFHPSLEYLRTIGMGIVFRSKGCAKWGFVTSKTKPLIAVVDDDESVCRAIKRLIRSLGMEAEAFTSGRDFIERIDATPSFQPDCLVLDVQMPGMNGLDVQQQLVSRSSRLPIVFITAHDEMGVRERALSAGALAFLRKPFNDELFIATLTAAVKRDTGGEQGGAP
jgi:CheY-like chemotaxis protein